MSEDPTTSSEDQAFVAPATEATPLPHIDDVPQLRAGKPVVVSRPGDPGHQQRAEAAQANLAQQQAAADSYKQPQQ